MDECFPRVTPQFVFSRTHKVDEAVQNSNIVNFVDSWKNSIEVTIESPAPGQILNT